MGSFKTIFVSNVPAECHIVKGRLETEGIPCFIFDENIVWVDPFKAIAVGGVKLKVLLDDYSEAKMIISLLNQGLLSDGNGEYPVADILNKEINTQNEIIRIKKQIRDDYTLLSKPVIIDSEFAGQIEIEELIKSEKEFQTLDEKKFIFSWKQFYYELFDFDRSVFAYLRNKPVDYYLEKEIVDNYISQTESESAICPKCNSGNAVYGYAIDRKWDVLYLIITLLLGYPLFLIRKKYHCFNCGHNFNEREVSTQNRLRE